MKTATRYSGTCLIRHSKGPEKCVGLYRMSEYSGFILVKRNTLGPYIFVGCHKMSENSGVGLHRFHCTCIIWSRPSFQKLSSSQIGEFLTLMVCPASLPSWMATVCDVPWKCFWTATDTVWTTVNISAISDGVKSQNLSTGLREATRTCTSVKEIYYNPYIET